MANGLRTQLRQSLWITRIERRRARRRLGRSSTWRTILAVGLVAGSGIGGIGAYRLGQSFRRGALTLPLETIDTAAVAGFLIAVWLSAQRMATTMKRLETAPILTSVSARTAALGVVGSVGSGLAVPLSLPVSCVVVGFTLGLRAPFSAVSVSVAIVGFATFATLLGSTLELAKELATLRSPRLRRYKTLLLVLGFGCLLLAWGVVAGDVVASDRLSSRLGAVPIVWIVDLGLLGVPKAGSSPLRPVGALCLLAVGISLCTALSIALAKRVWQTEPTSSGTSHRSRSLLEGGFVTRPFAGRVSRPVRVVARKRWRQERRVPRGLLTAGYMLLVLPIVYLPLLAAGEVLAVTPILVAFVFAVGTGLAFGIDLLGVEYPALPMTLTSVPSRQFVRGTIFAGTAIGAPVTAVITAVAGWGSPLGGLETILSTVGSVVLCLCSVTLAAAMGMDVSYRDLRLVPVPFVSTPVYSETGRRSFLRMGVVMGVVGLVCLPAFAGALSPVTEQLAAGLGTSRAVVRTGALAGTIAFALAVTAVSYRRAVTSFEEYTLP